MSHQNENSSENSPSPSTIQDEEEECTRARISYLNNDNGEVDTAYIIKLIFEGNYRMFFLGKPSSTTHEMGMVKKFLEIQVDSDGIVIDKEKSSNRKIFVDNDILVSKDKELFDKYFATFPVIHVSFKPISGDSFDEIYDKFRFVLHEVFKQHKYLLKSEKLSSDEKEVFQTYCNANYKKLTKTDSETGLKFLSECVYKHFDNKKLFLLIDELDSLIIKNSMDIRSFEFKRVHQMLEMIVLNTFQENQFVARAFVTTCHCPSEDVMKRVQLWQIFKKCTELPY